RGGARAGGGPKEVAGGERGGAVGGRRAAAARTFCAAAVPGGGDRDGVRGRAAVPRRRRVRDPPDGAFRGGGAGPVGGEERGRGRRVRSVRFGRGVLFEGSPPGGCRDAAAARSGPGAARGSSVRPAARFPKQDGS